MKKQLALLLVPAAAVWLSAPASADIIFGTSGPFGAGNSGKVTLSDDFYQYDDGSSETSVGFGGVPAQTMWLQSYEIIEGFATITAVSTTYGSRVLGGAGVNAGDPVDVYVYEDNDLDPTNDGGLG